MEVRARVAGRYERLKSGFHICSRSECSQISQCMKSCLSTGLICNIKSLKVTCKFEEDLAMGCSFKRSGIREKL